MSEEEKKAIEDLRQIRESYIRADECGLSNNDFKGEIEILSIILNLIEKQQAQLKKKDNIIDKMAETLAGVKAGSKYCNVFKKPPCKTESGIKACASCRKEYFTKLVEEKTNE